MADMPSDFWGGWIAVITVVSLAGLAWALFSVYFSSNGEEEQKSLVWDENLREGSNAPPMWWFWLIFSAMICTVVYLILYPGLGTYRGVLRWSQAGHMDHTDTLFEDTFGELRAEIAAAPIEVLEDNAVAMETAGRIFRSNCAICHGENARGQGALFPDLTDADWHWGGTPEQIEQTIRLGRQAVMPPHGELIGEESVEDVVDYLMALSSGAPVADDDPGRVIFGTYCFACHGQDATGNPLIGAPNLTDEVWLYGGGREMLTETVSHGRNGVMPAFGERLDDTQIHLLVAWLLKNAEE
jgi:cytochrome c oxidase cbb3-type subunit 3